LLSLVYCEAIGGRGNEYGESRESRFGMGEIADYCPISAHAKSP
jgi:hypothetical protein